MSQALQGALEEDLVDVRKGYSPRKHAKVIAHTPPAAIYLLRHGERADEVHEDDPG